MMSDPQETQFLSIPGQENRPQQSARPCEASAAQMIARIFASNGNLNVMQAQIVSAVCQVMGGDAGILLLVYEGWGNLVVKDAAENSSIREYQFEAAGSRQSLSDWIEFGDMDQAIAAILRRETGQNKLFHKILPGFTVGSSLYAPLEVDGSQLGLIAVLNKAENTFDSHDQELIASLATSIAHAIHTLRLVQDLKVVNADLEVSRSQLLKSRNTLRALFDSIPASFYIIDNKYNLIAINYARAHKANREPKMLVGRRCYQMLYGRDDPCPDCRVLETLFGGKSTSRTKRLWQADGDTQEWEISTYPIYGNEDQVVQAILLEQDVTEKRKLESTLIQSEKLAVVGQLAAGLAHEINNPLTAIVANAQMLQRELPPDDDRQELVELISRASSRAAQVVRNLLDLARNKQYELVFTDVNETLQKALSLLQHELISRSVELIMDLTPDLPLIKASQDHLQGVWLNLVVNAADAMEGKPGTIRVTTAVKASAVKAGKDRPCTADRPNTAGTAASTNAIQVIVADTGTGIPPERLPRLFEPFYTTKIAGRGTGLGLSVCQRVIKEHGGHILVDSQVGQGTVFTIVLPIER